MAVSSEDPAFRMIFPLTLQPLSAAANLIPATGALSITLLAIMRFSADCPGIDDQPMPVELALVVRGELSSSKRTALPDMMIFATGRFEFGSRRIPEVDWGLG